MGNSATVPPPAPAAAGLVCTAAGAHGFRLSVGVAWRAPVRGATWSTGRRLRGAVLYGLPGPGTAPDPRPLGGSFARPRCADPPGLADVLDRLGFEPRALPHPARQDTGAGWRGPHLRAEP